MKKSIALLLVFLLLASTLVLPASAEQEKATVFADVKSAELSFSGTEDDAFRVAITIKLPENVPGIAAYTVTVQWDPEALTPVIGSSGHNCYFRDSFGEGWTMLSDGSSLVNNKDIQNGSITVASTSVSNRTPKDGVLFLMEFRPTGTVPSTQVKVVLGSRNVKPELALSSASGTIPNVVSETSLTLQLKSKTGDINGDGKIDIIDYVLVKRYYLGTLGRELTEIEMQRADANHNGRIEALDYFLIKKAALSDTFELN